MNTFTVLLLKLKEISYTWTKRIQPSEEERERYKNKVTEYELRYELEGKWIERET